MRRLAVLALLLLGACVSAPPDPGEMQAMQSALRPSSPQAAQAAVKAYFDKSLFDGPAARYEFDRAPVLGVSGRMRSRRVGWMMCGRINGKNRMGGYTGFREFFVYFSPTSPDTVEDGIVGDDEIATDIVRERCEEAYRKGA